MVKVGLLIAVRRLHDFLHNQQSFPLQANVLMRTLAQPAVLQPYQESVLTHG